MASMKITSVTWSATDLPKNLSITQDGKITGTPDVQPGDYTATISVTTKNGDIVYGSDTKTITIRVAVPDSWKPIIEAGQIVNTIVNEKLTPDYEIRGTNIKPTV